MPYELHMQINEDKILSNSLEIQVYYEGGVCVFVSDHFFFPAAYTAVAAICGHVNKVRS